MQDVSFGEGKGQPRCASYINSALCNSAVKLSYCICRQCIFSPYLHLIWNVYLLYFYCFYNYCGDTFSALGHKGRCRPYALLEKKYAPLERSNQCNICFITSLFLTPIIIIMNTANAQYIYFWCGNILKEKNVLASCEEKCDWGIQAEPRLPLNGLLMIITIIILSIL